MRLCRIKLFPDLIQVKIRVCTSGLKGEQERCTLSCTILRESLSVRHPCLPVQSECMLGLSAASVQLAAWKLVLFREQGTAGGLSVLGQGCESLGVSDRPQPAAHSAWGQEPFANSVIELRNLGCSFWVL